MSRRLKFRSPESIRVHVWGISSSFLSNGSTVLRIDGWGLLLPWRDNNKIYTLLSWGCDVLITAWITQSSICGCWKLLNPWNRTGSPIESSWFFRGLVCVRLLQYNVLFSHVFVDDSHFHRLNGSKWTELPFLTLYLPLLIWRRAVIICCCCRSNSITA